MVALPFAIRGAIEGFYGPPWSWEDRHRLVDFLAGHGFNTYAYAPKNDPLHRDRWREPYLPEEWDRFADLDRACARAGIDFVFGVSPLALRASDEQDVTLLLDKFAAARDAGIRRFCLLVDDMPDAFSSSSDAERFGTLAAAHASVVERVRTAFPDCGLWFVPLHYHGDPAGAYIREIGARVHADVEVCWTGPEICSPELSLEHTRAVTASLARPVLYWDNHPVNDCDMADDPHLGPLRGRDPRLPSAAGGLVANLAIQPEASRIALATIGEYCADPGGYDPEAAWRRALLEVTGDGEDARAVAVLADLAPRSPLEVGDPLENALAGPFAVFRAAWVEEPGTRRKALRALADTLEGVAAAARRLDGGLRNTRLGEDLAPWAAKLDRQATAALGGVEVLGTALDHPADPRLPAARVRVLDLLASARQGSSWVAGDQLEVLTRDCLRYADALAAPPAPVPPAAPGG